MRTSFGNVLARMGRAMATQPRFNTNDNIFRGCYMQLRQASAAGKNPETNLTRGKSAARLPTPTSKPKVRTKHSNKSPLKAAHTRLIPPIAKKVDIVVRPSISSRSDPRSTKERCQSGFHNTVLDDLVWPRDSQIIRLPSGAQLSYARLGRLKEVGQCWVIFHGTPGSRLGVAAIHGYAETHGVRIITIDRPGYGYSTVHGRGILGFMQDVEHLLDYHGIQEFKVYGVSGGGPYALGAAFHFPKSRLSKTYIMCGSNHPDFASTELSLRTRLTTWLRGRAFFLYSSGGNFNYFLDRDVVSAKGNETKILRARLNWQEAARQGHEGYNNDLRLMVRPWGFDLENMDANSIRWYHGTIDTNVSHDAARKTAEIANRYKRNIDFRAYDGLDHGTIQSEKICECLNWMLK